MISAIDVEHGQGFWRVLYVVLLGQLVSFSMALMGFTSSLSANLGVNCPITLVFFTYLALTLVFGSILLYRRQKLQISWYWYVLLAIVDVQGNYLVNRALQLSSVTSVTLLSCWTIVLVIIFTWLFLGTKYSLWQFFGAAVCVLGLCLVLLSDSDVDDVDAGGGSNPVLGDAFVLVGSCFFAMSNVGEEFFVKNVGRIELTAMFGLFGMLVSLIEMAIFESTNLKLISWSPEVILTFAGYGISGFMFYSFTPLVLLASGATLFTLSLLTANMWVVLIRVFLYNQKVEWLYYVSVLFVVVGIVIYLKTGVYSNELSEPEIENDDPEKNYQLLVEDAIRV